MIDLDIRRVVVTNSKSTGKYIRFSGNGQIAVSSETVTALGITPTDRAVFFQDNKDHAVWYFSFGPQGDYPLKGTGKENDGTVTFSNSTLRNLVLDSLSLPKGTYRLWLSNEPAQLDGKKLWRLNYRK